MANRERESFSTLWLIPLMMRLLPNHLPLHLPLTTTITQAARYFVLDFFSWGLIDFSFSFSCAVFGKGAEFAEKYLHKGTKIAITGRLETGSYTNKDGVKVYTTTVIVEEQEFAESKASSQNNAGGNYQQPASNNSSSGDGFMNVPDGIDEELPFV